jgi:hypothetical protein
MRISGMSAARVVVSLAWVLAVVPTVPRAWAQTRASITGSVTDGTGAVLPGATLTLESPNLVGGAQSVTSDERGGYRFSDLPPGAYQLQASLAGFQTLQRKGLRLTFGTTITVDISLTVGTAETVTVEGESPTVDVTTAQSTTKVDADLIQNLPLFTNQREAYTVFELSPGSKDRASFGGSRDSNELLLDGAPATLPERQGTNSAVVATNWLEEVQVVSLGANAEYGEFGGTVGNLVVRSGSNELHGLLEYKTVRSNWLDENTGSLPPALQARFRPNQIVSRWDSSAQVGGPVVKERLFFFGGFSYLYDETQIAGAPAPSKQTWPRYVGKLNWAVASNVKAEGTYSYSKSTSLGGGAQNATIETAGNTGQPNHIWSGRVTWAPSDATLWEFRTGGLDHVQDIAPRPPRTKAGPPPRRDVVTGISSVNAAQWRLQEGSRLSFGASLTRRVDGIVGRSHAFKLGSEYEHNSFLTESGFPGGLSFSDRSGVPDLVTIWGGDRERGSGNRTTFYAQDDWKLNGRVTLQPGLRFSLYRGSTPTTGENFRTSPLSPRLGLAWDVGAGHKTVVRAQWGRFHEALSTAVWDFADTAGRTPRITARVLADGSFQEINRVTPAGNTAVDQDISHAYMDQFFAGVERELLADLSVKLQYVHRDYKNIYAFVDTRSVYAPVQARDPGPDNVAGNADDGALMTVYALTNPGQAFLLLTNPEGAKRSYDAVQIVAQKRWSRNWQLLGSYTWSRSRGNANNQVTDNVGGASAGETGVFANPNTAINAEGRNTLDFPHNFSMRASYHSDLIAGFNLSGSYTYSSGGAWSRTATFRLPQGNVAVRVAPRGSEKSDPTNQLDFRFEKLLPLPGKGRNLGVYVDLFNALNRGWPPQARYTEASGGNFGLPLNWAEGRSFQLSARIKF